MKWFFICLAVLVAIIVIVYKSGKKSKPTTSGPAQRQNTPVKEESRSMRSINEELLEEARAAGDEEGVQYYTRKLDDRFQAVSMEYTSKGAELAEMRTDTTVPPEKFEKACNDYIKLTLLYRDMHDKYYDSPLQYSDAFKTYAMFLEKQGRYLDAARVCARALNLGFPNDKTQGGMAGRLVRMVKKAGGETTAEIEAALNRYCR